MSVWAIAQYLKTLSCHPLAMESANLSSHVWGGSPKLLYRQDKWPLNHQSSHCAHCLVFSDTQIVMKHCNISILSYASFAKLRVIYAATCVVVFLQDCRATMHIQHLQFSLSATVYCTGFHLFGCSMYFAIQGQQNLQVVICTNWSFKAFCASKLMCFFF